MHPARKQRLILVGLVVVLSSTAIGFSGILPDLFAEGEGIVAEGRLDEQGVLIATQVLAKHDENYMPPEVAAALEGNTPRSAAPYQP